MQFRPATQHDFDNWLAMRQDLYTELGESFHRAEMESILASDEITCFMAMSDEREVMGLLELSLRNLVDGCIGGPVGYIEGIYLKPQFRSQHHGKAMIEFAESWCKQRGCSELATDTDLENVAAQGFFQRVGFTETWRIVEFKKSLEA